MKNAWHKGSLLSFFSRVLRLTTCLQYQLFDRLNPSRFCQTERSMIKSSRTINRSRFVQSTFDCLLTLILVGLCDASQLESKRYSQEYTLAPSLFFRTSRRGP